MNPTVVPILVPSRINIVKPSGRTIAPNIVNSICIRVINVGRTIRSQGIQSSPIWEYASKCQDPTVVGRTCCKSVNITCLGSLVEGKLTFKCSIKYAEIDTSAHCHRYFLANLDPPRASRVKQHNNCRCKILRSRRALN